MSLADLKKLVERATPGFQDVRAPDMCDFVRREKGNLTLREVVDAVDALEFAVDSFMPRMRAILKETPDLVPAAEADSVADGVGGVTAAVETSVHTLFRALDGLRILSLETSSSAVEDATSGADAGASHSSAAASQSLDAKAEPVEGWQDAVAESKRLGAESFKKKEYRRAAELYDDAIRAVPCAGELPEMHTLYSNRSAALLQLDDAKAALADARRCVELAPSWPKGRFREGSCLRQLGRYSEAVSAFDAGQELEPANKDWVREAEKTQRLLRAEPKALAHQLVVNLLPEIVRAWLRGKEACKGQDSILQLQVMGELEQVGAPKWQLLKDRKDPPKAQIRYAFITRKEYLTNLAALMQAPPADVATVDIAGRPLKIAEVGSFFASADSDAIHVHIDVKRAAPLSNMAAIICSLPCSGDVRRFAPPIKDPPLPKNSVEPVLQLQRKSFPKAYPRLLGFQIFPGDLNFPVVDVERDAPGLLTAA